VPTKTAAKPTRNVALAAAIARDGRYVYQVGGAASVNPTYLGKVIRGTVRPSAAVKERLAAALNTPVSDLFPDPAA
jgi:transcriptional regulator with XRE-family HTH domain